MNKLVYASMVGAAIFLSPGIVVCQSNVANIQSEKDSSADTSSVATVKPQGEISLSSVRVLTSKEYYAERRKWKEKCYLKEYQSAGQHNQKWDTKVESLIRSARCNSDKWGDLTAKEREEVVAEFESIRASGCADPLLLAMHSSALLKEKMYSKAVIAADLAMSGFSQSRYAYSTRLVAAKNSCLANKAAGKQGDAKKAAITLREWLVKAASDWVYQNECQGYYADTFDNYCNLSKDIAEGDQILTGRDGNPQAMLDLVLSMENADPWIKAYVAGKCHVSLGWLDRGGSWAYKVTDAGWKGFGKHLSEARRCFVEAYPLHPEFPHIAAEMIPVAMGSSCGNADEERLWFDRAVAAQFDYMHAYSSYLWAIRPRWGGSHEKMLAFGRECLATKRFDTAVPYYFMQVLSDIASELPDFNSIYQRDDLWSDISTYFEGRIEKEQKSDDCNYQYSYFAAVAWVARRPEVAAAIYKRSDGKVVEHAAQRVRLRADELECLLKICSGIEGVELQEALSSYISKQTSSALSRAIQLGASIKDVDLSWGLNEFLIHQPLAPPSRGTAELVDLMGSKGRTELLFRKWDACIKEGIEGPATMILSNRVQRYLGQTGMAFAGKLHNDKIDSAKSFEAYVNSVDALLQRVESTNDLEKTQHELGMMRARSAWCCIRSTNQLVKAVDDRVNYNDLANLNFQSHMNQCPDKAELLEFMLETLEQAKMCRVLIKYLIMVYHNESQKPLWSDYEVERDIIARIENAKVTDEKLLLECSREFKGRGSLSLALRFAHLLREKGLNVEARRYEELVTRWQRIQMEYAPHAWAVMYVYNLVPGYEQKVLDISKKADNRCNNFDSFWYFLADAYLRTGNNAKAASVLAKGRECRIDRGILVNPFGKFENTQLYAESLEKRLKESGQK